MFKYSVINYISIITLVLLGWSSPAYSDASQEYQLKAAYLLNFARFIYWPEEVFSDESSDFNICVYGDNPFGDNLDKLSNKKIQKKGINVKYTSDISKKLFCHMVFISESEKNKYVEIINGISDQSILTVSDIDGFCEAGGMIGFIRIKNKIKFEINIDKSTSAGIKYRSQLLEVAEKLK